MEGSAGHRTPALLIPEPGELVVHKRGFSPFAEGDFTVLLRRHAFDTLLLCGVYLRACIRTTALDAYQRGFRVRIAAAASGDDDPLHAAITTEYLHRRSIALLSPEVIPAALLDAGALPLRPQPVAHRAPRDGRLLGEITPFSPPQVEHALATLRRPCLGEEALWRQEAHAALAGVFAQAPELSRSLALEVGKPLPSALSEIDFAIGLLRATLSSAAQQLSPYSGEHWWARRRPLGLVAVVTPWNNPLAIPVGKLAPALLAGNAVAWKPAIAGFARAQWLVDALVASGLPSRRLVLLPGDDETATALLANRRIDAITLTGGPLAGATALMQAARRMVPLQAELGGNNAAIVWTGADLVQAARALAEGAFGFAGQRCTANRRVIVKASLVDGFRSALLEAMAALRWGDPLDPSGVVGPVISAQAQRRLEALIGRARCCRARVYQPHPSPQPQGADSHEPLMEGFWVPPTLVETDDSTLEVVQEESFGPILVLQVAHTWEEALTMLNGVEQGLAAALFSDDPVLQASFLHQARAGLLRLNRSTAGARPEAPFCGWKRSGIGPAEHGPAALEAFTRVQTIEGLAPPAAPDCAQNENSC